MNRPIEMKAVVAVSLLALGLGLGLPARAAEDPGSHSAASVATDAASWTEGTVRKVDRAAGKVTLAHEPLENLGMPAMTMVFRLKDPAWLDRLEPGERIRFVADKVNGAFTVVRLESGG